MTRTGAVVTLEVAKQGAIYHGLATLLNQPSPLLPRACPHTHTHVGTEFTGLSGSVLVFVRWNVTPDSLRKSSAVQDDANGCFSLKHSLFSSQTVKCNLRAVKDSAADRGRDKNGKLRPKSEGFELYNNSVQNGSPESPQAGWDSYPEPKKTNEDRLLKNRADHRSSPNVANQSQSPASKAVYPGGPGTKITSVSTGNLCADDEPSPPHPEEYPIPTQTYPREYFTIPASKSQDRVVGPGPGPPQHWQGVEDRERLPVVENIHNNNSMQRINHSQEDLYPPPGGMRPDMQPLYQQDYQPRDLDYQLDYQRGPPGGGPEHWTPQPQVSSSLESSTSTGRGPEETRGAAALVREGEGSAGGGEPHNNGGSMPPPHHQQPPPHHQQPPPHHQQPPLPSVTPPMPYLPPQPQPPPPRPLASLPRSAVPPPASHPAGMDTVIRELLPQQQPRTIERRDLQYITISKEELSTSDSLSPDPWKRDAREKAEKQQQLHIVDLLDKEIQDLQSKPERTAEESDRLRKLMLEWQFQKRLQESKHSDEDEEEEDDEDVDTMMIMQRLEAEKRARLQDEERRRKQQLEEIRKREAEERAKQEEDRRWRDEAQRDSGEKLQDEERRRKQQLEEIRKREAEERAKQEEDRRWRDEAQRDSGEKRRQEEEYYTRLEAERRRQHDVAERKLLTPDDPPSGLYRPPLPRDYQPPAPPLNPTNTPPPPPQRNTSYLKTQVKLSATRKSYGDLPAAPNHSRPQPPPTARKPRPLSDGIFLSSSFQMPVNNNSNSTGPPLPAKPSSVPPGGFKGYNSYTGNSAGVVGSGEVYNDPRDKWTK
ncbi:hypothetical protein JOQ06_027716, partial [Pogonophryne albipinna]